MIRTEHRIHVDLRTGRGQNNREHWRAADRRKSLEREMVEWMLAIHERKNGKPEVPCTVLLQRLGPSPGLDDDNLSGALKTVRDVVADWLGVDDKHRDIVRYEYAQERRTHWGVLITIRSDA